MKKKATRRPYRYALLFLLGVLLLILFLSSCDLKSITESLGGGTQDVFLPLPNEGTSTPPSTEASGSTPQTEGTEPVTSVTEPPQTTLPVTTVPPIPTYYDPLIGLPCRPQEALARPFAVCVSNTASGCERADLLIEAPIENGGTRLLLLSSKDMGVFSTTASTRPHLAALANDFFAISVYRGTSDNGRPTASFLYDTLDFSEQPAGTPIDRNTALTLALGKQYSTVVSQAILLPYTLAAVGESVTPTGGHSSYVSIPYTERYAVDFTYDSLTKVYTMRHGGAVSQSANLTFSNLLILFCDTTQTHTGSGSELTVNTNAGGIGYYCSAGGTMPIRWTRDPGTSNLTVTDEDGAKLTVNRGKTYVSLLSYESRPNLVLH